MNDDELNAFYEKNKDMIDRIIEEKSRETPREDRFREDYTRTLKALDELRDTMVKYGREQYDFVDARLREDEEIIRAREQLRMERARIRMEEAKLRAREESRRFRDEAWEEFDDVFSFLNDPSFQKHVIGAGMELFAAFNAMVQNGPFPDSFKSMARSVDINRTEEFCRKNPRCHYRAGDEAEEAPAENREPVKVTVTRKKKTGDSA